MSEAEDKEKGVLTIDINYINQAQDSKTMKMLLLKREEIDRNIARVHQRMSDRLEKAAREKDIETIDRRLKER